MKKILAISFIVLAIVGTGCNGSAPSVSSGTATTATAPAVDFSETSKTSAPIEPERYVGKWVGLDFIIFNGAPAKSAVLLVIEQADTVLSGKFTAVLSAAEPAIRTMEGDVDEASLSFQSDGTLLWTLDKKESSGDYSLPSQIVLYRDRTDELGSEEKQKIEKAVQKKINADPQYKQKAFAYVEQILGDYARVGIQTYDGDNVARVYVRQTLGGWEAITGVMPLSETDVKALNLEIPAPLF